MTRHPTTDLSVIRAIVAEQVDQAMLRAQRLASPDVSMPHTLLQACLWIVDQQEYPACEGENYFAWPPETQRRYLDQLSHDQRVSALAAGYRVIFEGLSPLVCEGLTEVHGDPRKTLSLRFAA